MKKTLFFAAGLLAVYVAVAFIAWEINPRNWDSTGRLVAVMLGVFVGSLASKFGPWHGEKGMKKPALTE